MTRPVPAPKNQFWFRWHGLWQSPEINFDFRNSLCQSPKINFDFDDTVCDSPQKSILISGTACAIPQKSILISGTACAGSQKSILILMTRPVPVPKNQFWFRWHGLCQSPRINFDFDDTACASRQEWILISGTACDRPQESVLISTTEPVRVFEYKLLAYYFHLDLPNGLWQWAFQITVLV